MQQLWAPEFDDPGAMPDQEPFPEEPKRRVIVIDPYEEPGNDDQHLQLVLDGPGQRGDQPRDG